MRQRSGPKRGLTIAAGLAALVVAAGALATPAAAATQYVIGLANNVVGNGWRDEMGCSVRGAGEGLRARIEGHRCVRQRQRCRTIQADPIPDLGGRQRDHRRSG